MQFAELAFKEAGIEIGWKGRGVHEKEYDKKSRKIIIQIDPRYFRPAEVDFLLGDPTKAKSNLVKLACCMLHNLLKRNMYI